VCLGIPGRVIEAYQEHGLRMGKVDFGGVCKRVCLEHVPEARPGVYVIVHVGFALSVIDETEAERVFTMLAGINELDELRHGGPDEVPG
jgi:hydrogenase expression/formation protein HypC